MTITSTIKVRDVAVSLPESTRIALDLMLRQRRVKATARTDVAVESV